MPLVTSSPWKDAAAYGSGLADTLSQIFLGIPKARYEMAQQRATAPLQMQLLQAKVDEAEAKPKLAEEMQEFREQNQKDREDYQKSSLDERTKYDKERIDQEKSNQDLRTQLATLHQNFQSLQDLIKGQPSVGEATKIAQGQMTDYAANMANKQGIDTKSTPITMDPSFSLSIIDQALKGRGTAGDNTAADTLQALIKATPILSPLLSTNQPPATTNWLTRAVTQPPPVVSTNGYSMTGNPSLQQQIVQQPQGQQQQQPQQPITATNPKTGQKVQLVNGQWVPL